MSTSKEEKTFLCPACKNVTMAKFTTMETDLLIDQCTACAGLWFDGGEIQQFLRTDHFKEQFMAPTSAKGMMGMPEGDRPCPRCGCGMAKPRLGNVTVDACPECSGVWFDVGELATLMEASKANQLDESDRVAAEIKAGLEGGSLNPGLFQQLLDAIKGAMNKRASSEKGAGSETTA